jgi:hypothetical protein
MLGKDRPDLAGEVNLSSRAEWKRDKGEEWDEVGFHEWQADDA